MCVVLVGGVAYGGYLLQVPQSVILATAVGIFGICATTMLK